MTGRVIELGLLTRTVQVVVDLREQVAKLAKKQGPKGDTGDTGPQGEKGDPGSKGDTGDAGQNGEKGDKGEKGERGPRGFSGSGAAFNPPDVERIQQTDYTDARFAYVGFASRIVRVDYSTSPPGKAVAASGDWANRLTLSYS